MKVLVLWADDRSANLGVRVLADGAALVAKAAFGPEVEVEFQDFSSRTLGAQLHRKSLVLSRRTIRDHARHYDLVLDTGAGDSFCDIYGLERLLVMTSTQRIFIKQGIPVVMLPQTLGPFRTRVGAGLARRIFRDATLTMARDSESARYAESTLGRRVSLTATDLVFALPEQDRPQPRFDVLLNVSGLLWSGSTHVGSDSYRTLIVGVIEALQAGGRRVALLAHVLDNPSADNDLAPIVELRERFPELTALVPIDLSDARRMISEANVVIASRMHACLNALSLGTRALPLAYSRKFGPLLGDLDFHHTVDLRSAPTVGRVLEALVAVERDDVAQVAANGRARLARAVEQLGGINVES